MKKIITYPTKDYINKLFNISNIGKLLDKDLAIELNKLHKTIIDDGQRVYKHYKKTGKRNRFKHRLR